MGAILIFVIFSLTTCLGHPGDAIFGSQLINGRGHKVGFLESKPALIANNETIHSASGENQTYETQLINGQGHKVEFRARKLVLLTIPETFDPQSDKHTLTKAKKQFLKTVPLRLPNVIHSLLYYETNRYGYETYSVWLYNLRDVAKLFINRFDIEIEYD